MRVRNVLSFAHRLNRLRSGMGFRLELSPERGLALPVLVA
jgi:hypothetical protein